MTKKTDLRFVQLLHNLVHIAFIGLIIWQLMAHIYQYQKEDQQLRVFLSSNRDNCMNSTIMLEHVLDKKNNLTQVFMLYLAYLLAVSVSLILVIANCAIILFLYTLFLTVALLFNLVAHFLMPHLFTATVFISCTTLNYVFLYVYLAPDRQPKLMTLTSRNEMNSNPHPSSRAMAPSLESFSVSEDF